MEPLLWKNLICICVCQEDLCAVPSLQTPRQVWTADGGSCPLDSRTKHGSLAASRHVLKEKKTTQSEGCRWRKYFNNVTRSLQYMWLLGYGCWCVITGEKVTAMFPQFEGLWIEAPGALVGLRTVHLPHGLHVLAIVRVQEQDHGVVLDVVQPLHRSGSDVQ